MWWEGEGGVNIGFVFQNIGFVFQNIPVLVSVIGIFKQFLAVSDFDFAHNNQLKKKIENKKKFKAIFPICITTHSISCSCTRIICEGSRN